MRRALWELGAVGQAGPPGVCAFVEYAAAAAFAAVAFSPFASVAVARGNAAFVVVAAAFVPAAAAFVVAVHLVPFGQIATPSPAAASATYSNLFISGAADRSGRGNCCSSSCCWGGDHFSSSHVQFFGV